MDCESFHSRIASYADGTLSAQEREPVETHLASCPVCADAVSATVRASEPLSSKSGVCAPPVSRRTRFSAAAAVLLAAGLAVLAWGVSSRWGDSPPEFPEAARWVRVEPADGARWQWDTGGSNAVRLDSGEVRFDVHSGKTDFAVRTPAGEVRVLGTSFSVRWIPPVKKMGGAGEKGVALVMLHDGKLLLSNREGEIRLTPAHYGILVSGLRPYPLERRAEPIRTDELEGIWNNLVSAVRNGERQEVALYTAVLAAHGEPAVQWLRGRIEETPKEEETVRRVITAIGF